MSSLLLEIVYVYPALNPPSLSAHASNRVCNALALLQCVASHPQTRSLFLSGQSRRDSFQVLQHGLNVASSYFIAHIPLFLYPFLNTTSKTRPFEYLRLTSLGVIGALVKVGSLRSQSVFCGSRCLRHISFTPIATGQLRRHQLPPLYRNHSALPPNHGIRLRAFENRCDLHRAKDLVR